jgi:ABC-2 type transport system ATP-binding protein
VIVAENVHVRFRTRLFKRNVHALQGMNLEVRDGDFFALVGQNGAGKSTAMYCFLGLLRPSSGEVKVLGRTPELGSSLYAGIAYLPEEPHYHLYLTVQEATRYYTSLYGRRVPEKQINDALDRLGLMRFKDLPLSKCSKGMKQKVGIAQCLIREPRLLFLDEPTRGLDPLAVRDFREALREIHKRGATIVMNSHVLSEIEMLANRVAIIERGKVVAQDELRNLMTLDTERYHVVFESGGDAPAFITSVERTGNQVSGFVVKDKLHEFMEFVRSNGVQLQECSLSKMTLEESFFKIVKGGEASQADAN